MSSASPISHTGAWRDIWCIFLPSVSQSVTPSAPSAPISLSVEVADRKQRCQRTGLFFSGELRAIEASASAAVTDDESRERVTGSCSLSPLSPQACLALTLRAMFSEGSCQSAVAQADGQMARVQPRDMKETGKVAAPPPPPT